MKKLFITFCLVIVSNLIHGLPGQIIQAQTETYPPTASPTDIGVSAQTFYMPLIMSQVRPATPTLNAIANPEGDGAYAVSWSAAQHAERYLLQVSVDANFVNPSPIAESADTIYTATAQPTGLYYYRVAALNSVGSSDWSNVQAVSVLPPTTFASIADATVLEAGPNQNFGSTADMWTGYDHCRGAKRTRSLVRFDLSAIPAGTALTQARLHLFLYGSCDLANRSHIVTGYPTSAAWEEGALTWNNQPAIGDAQGSVSVRSRQYDWYVMDITELARQWVNGALPNQGLMLRGPESSGNDSARLVFLAREAGRAYAPYIEIQYANTQEVQAVNHAAVEPAPAVFELHQSSIDMPLSGARALLTVSEVADAETMERFVYEENPLQWNESAKAQLRFIIP